MGRLEETMLKKHEQLQIQNLLNHGMPVVEISERTGRSLGTIYKYKRLGNKLVGNKSRGSSVPVSLRPYQGFIDKRLSQRKYKQTDLYFEVQQRGYKGRRILFETYCKERRQLLLPQRSVRHIETKPGEQAQVDWAHFGVMNIGGNFEKVYLFVYILSYSRAIYLEFVARQSQRTLQECHTHAFNRVGIPQVIYYDNMKTVVARREKLNDGTKKVHYTPAFMSFAKYYQFSPEACPPYWPRTKGKVENTISYVRGYFSRLNPRIQTSLEALNTQLWDWVENTASQRIHATTGQKPYDRWIEEKPYLSFPGKLPPYNNSPFRSYYTTQYGLFVCGGITYNLGSEFARIKIDIHERQEHGLIFLDIYRHQHLLTSVRVPSGRHGWVDITLPNNNLHAETKIVSRYSAKKIPSELVVEQRDLSYYSMSPMTGSF